MTSVELHLEEAGGRWYGLATTGAALVATAVAPTRRKALEDLRRSLPANVGWRLAEGLASTFAEKTIAMLVELEAGRESGKEFRLDPGVVVEPFASILRIAAAIPRGYVTTYGDIARVAGAEARDVGTAMARNPVYPIVPCHRVVGAGFELVGYAGSRGAPALRDKLGRLAREAQGYRTDRDVPVEGGTLRVYPVERAIARAERRGLGEEKQRPLFE